MKAVYLALGMNMAGDKEILGLWIASTEGAKFWLQVVTELKNRGVQDIFIHWRSQHASDFTLNFYFQLS